MGHRMQNVHFSTHLQQLRGYLAFIDLINNQSIAGEGNFWGLLRYNLSPSRNP